MGRRKKRISIKKKNAILGLIIFFAVVVAGFIVAVNASGLLGTMSEKSGVEKSGNDNREIIIRSGEEDTDAGVLEPILGYFKVSFNALADLKSADLTRLFKDSTSENAQINQSALNYLIGLRLSQNNDLHMANYSVGLSITEVSESDGMIEVTVEEDHTVNFAFISDIDSSSSGIKHTFLLDKGPDGYVIVEHTEDEDTFLMIEEAINKDGNSRGLVDELLSEKSSGIAELARAKGEYNSSNEKTTDPSAENPYSSGDAVNYAMAWVDPIKVIRNEDDFGIYDDYGGNCNNFISQCLNAGGIPMDNIGDIKTQWKWYDDAVNFDEIPSGRSPSWAGVEEFYTYASENTGFGLKAVVGDNVYSGRPGDVLQFAKDGDWVHSVIITEVVKDDQGNVLDYLVNSNTTDRINYPVSAYGYIDLRLIKIMGWNEE